MKHKFKLPERIDDATDFALLNCNPRNLTKDQIKSDISEAYRYSKVNGLKVDFIIFDI